MIELLLALQLSTAQLAPPSPTPEWHPLVMHAALASTILAHSADLSTTAYAMGRASEGRRSYREANPFLRPFADDPVKLAIIKIGVAGALNYYLWRTHARRPKLTVALALAQTVAFGYVTHRNAQTLGLR